MGAWSDEARAAHAKRMKDVWAKKRTGGGPRAVVPARPTTAVVKRARAIDVVTGTVVDHGATVAGIESAIARRREELSILEQAREIVARG